MEQQTLTEITTLTISKLISVIQNKYFITGAIVGGCFIYQYVSPKSFGTLSNKETNFQLLKDSSNNNDDEERKMYGELDIRRMHQILAGKPTDHAGEVVILVNEEFDLDATIFGSITSSFLRYFQSQKLGIKLYWSDKITNVVRNAYENIPKAPKYDKPLVDFMSNDCNFAMEHADGSFMDHLKFCYEYSYKHFPEKSARVLLLHSIMGVGTNFFPMDKSKIGKLQSLINDFEFNQIAMFPTVLRLFYYGPLRYDLEALVDGDDGIKKLKKLKTVVMYRVIDNEKMEIKAEDFWIQLNYQLIHLLDFLPAASWKLHVGDNFLDNFIAMHNILSKSNNLKANVDYNAQEGESTTGGQAVTLASIIRGYIPTNVQIALAQRQIYKFSNAIGHSLDYELVFE